jgi:hypothetical protein
MRGEQLLTFIWINLILFGGGGLLWLRVIRPIYLDTVKPFLDAQAAKQNYVTPPPQPSPIPPRSNQEREPEYTHEPATEPDVELHEPTKTTYTEAQLEREKRTARDQGAAEALGVMSGLGLLTKERESEIMERLYGKRGRRWQTVRPLIEQARAAVNPPEREPIKVLAGKQDEYEVER